MQGSEELRVDQGGLGGRETHAVGVVTEQTEVGILVDTHRDQALDVGNLLGTLGGGLVLPDLGVGGSESGDTLKGGEEDATDVGAAIY